jgi:hypothetical protein
MTEDIKKQIVPHGRLILFKQSEGRLLSVVVNRPIFTVVPKSTGQLRPLSTLEDLGWKEGANIRIDRRWAASDVAGLRTQASELARLGLDSADGRAAQ